MNLRSRVGIVISVGRIIFKVMKKIIFMVMVALTLGITGCVDQNYRNQKNYEEAKSLSRKIFNVMKNYEKGMYPDSVFEHKMDSLGAIMDSTRGVLDPLSVKALATYNAELMDQWIREKMEEEEEDGR